MTSVTHPSEPMLHTQRRRRRRRVVNIVTAGCAVWTILGAIPDEFAGAWEPRHPRTLDIVRSAHRLIFVEAYDGRLSIAHVTTTDDLLATASPSRLRYLRQRAIVVDPLAATVFSFTSDESMTAFSIGVSGPPHGLYMLPMMWTIAQFFLVIFRIAKRGMEIVKRGRRVRRGFCGDCGYNLTGNVSGVCPECGSKTLAEWEAGP